MGMIMLTGRVFLKAAIAVHLVLASLVVPIDCCTAQSITDQLDIETSTSAAPGLLILSHGAPRAEWNEPVEAVVNRVRTLNEGSKVFHCVAGAFLEFTQPDAAAGVKRLEDAGCDRIIVVPLFIAPSSHSLVDVPAVLGLYSSPGIHAVLKQEGARVAQPKVPVTITQTLSEGDLLDRFIRDEVLELSTQPSEEAVVILAHGSPEHQRLVDRALRRIATYCSGQCTVDYVDWAFCAVGQTFLEDAVPAIARAAETKKRVIVVGLYVSSSAKSVFESAMRREPEQLRNTVVEALEAKDIVFSDKRLVDYDETAQWVLECAENALIAMQHAACD
jgi:hypothetical protein